MNRRTIKENQTFVSFIQVLVFGTQASGFTCYDSSQTQKVSHSVRNLVLIFLKIGFSKTVLFAFVGLAAYVAAGLVADGSEAPGQFVCKTKGNVNTRGIADGRFRWPGGVVYYKFGAEAKPEDNEIVVAGMKEISSKSCITFVERTIQKNYIKFRHNAEEGECSSQIGMRGGQQVIKLSWGSGKLSNCMYPHVVAHEILHALGFEHEQSRYDRDDYVRILWDHVNKTEIAQFEKQDKKYYTNYGPYDFKSLMHYGSKYFSIDEQRTIEAIKDPEMELGNTEGLTELDAIKLRKMYNCK